MHRYLPCLQLSSRGPPSSRGTPPLAVATHPFLTLHKKLASQQGPAVRAPHRSKPTPRFVSCHARGPPRLGTGSSQGPGNADGGGDMGSGAAGSGPGGGDHAGPPRGNSPPSGPGEPNSPAPRIMGMPLVTVFIWAGVLILIGSLQYTTSVPGALGENQQPNPSPPVSAAPNQDGGGPNGSANGNAAQNDAADEVLGTTTVEATPASDPIQALVPTNT